MVLIKWLNTVSTNQAAERWMKDAPTAVLLDNTDLGFFNKLDQPVLIWSQNPAKSY